MNAASPRLPTIMPAAPSLHRVYLPVELWESVLLELIPQEVLSLRLLNREFRNLIDFSPAAQYRIDLCSSELEEGTVNASTPLNHRRELLKSYCSRWDRFDRAGEKSFVQPPHGNSALVMGFGHVVYNVKSGPGTGDIHFVRVTSGSTGGSRKEWAIRGVLGGACDRYAIHPPSNLLASLQVTDGGRSLRIHLLQMYDGGPHPEAISSIIAGPVFPPNVYISDGELQLSGHRVAAKVVVGDAPRISEHLIVWDWKTGEKCMEIMDSHRMWARFIDDYRLLIAVADWITTPRLWNTAIPAQPGSDSFVEFGLGPDYTIDTIFRNPFYFNLGSSYDAPFHEGASRQLVGIRVTSRSHTRRGGTLLLVRYGDLVKFASRGRSWIKWGVWEDSIIRIEFEPTVREFGLLHSHLLVARRDLKDSGTLLYIYDFTVHSRRQQTRDGTIVDRPPLCTIRKFPISAESGRLSDFRFAEDAVLALVNSADGSTSLRLWTV